MIKGAKLSQDLIIETVEDGQKVDAQAPSSTHMLCERMTFNQLYGYSERKRKDRSQNVKGPSLKLEAFKGGERAWFSFSSLERTEGRRHKGYIQFFPPRRANTPLERLECVVDCTCFTGEALVLMGDGTYRQIKDVKVGDLVYTHTGAVRKVLAHMPRNLRSGEKIYEVRASGFNKPMRVTGEHPFYVLRGNDKCLCGCGGSLWNVDPELIRERWSPEHTLRKRYLTGHGRRGQQLRDLSCGLFQWVQVKEFRPREYALSPWLNGGTNQLVSPELARLLGYYAAEGCIPNKRGTEIRLAFNIDEIDTLVKDVADLCTRFGFKFRVQPWARTEDHLVTGVEVRIQDRGFRNLCKTHVGVGSHNKKLSAELMSCSNDILCQFVTGVVLGDGSINGCGVRYGSSSRNLLSQVSTILKRLKICHTITWHGDGGTIGVTDGASAETVYGWLFGFLREKDRGHAFSDDSSDFNREEGELKALTEARQIDCDEPVYDITVEGDESFIVHGVAAHNCKDFRYRWAWAVKQRGSSVVGPNSFNKAWNRAPRITNSSARPGICKHLLALKRYIQGLYTNFESEKPNDGRYLDRMIRAANRQVISSDTGRPISPTDSWTSAARGQAAAKPAQPAKPAPKKAAPAPLPTPTTIKPGQVDPRRRRRESLDRVVMGMTPSAPERNRLLQEVEELEAELQQGQKATPPADGPAMPPELAPGEDLVSLVRSIRDMIAKLVGGDEISSPTAPEAPKKEEPAIPADAQKLSN